MYATSVASDDVVVMRRNPSTGALTQPKGAAGCVAPSAKSGCAVGRALDGPDVVTVSPDGDNVYVGSFLGNAVVTFDRGSTGGLTQPADTSGCLTNTATSGCATGLALSAPEGMAVSGDGANVYVASAASNAVVVLARDASSGALTQATDGTGCVSNAALTGCTTGTQLGGANAVAVSADDDDVYVTSLTSNSLTSFTRTAGTGVLTQKTGTSACAVNVLAIGCSLARALVAPEGLTVSPDGANVYAAGFRPGALDSFNRDTGSGAVIQKAARAGARSPTPYRPAPWAAGSAAPAPSWSAPMAGTPTRPRSPATRSASSGGTPVAGSDNRITRAQLLKAAAVATPGLVLGGQAAQARPAPRRWRRGHGRGHERAGVPDRPAARDPALPARVVGAQPARPDPAQEARHELRPRVHQRVHVLAGALDADVRLLPRPARRQVHA